MIFGVYPCCEGGLCLSLPESAPKMAKEDCPHCGARVWHLLSRLDPQSWTEADFLAEYEVDEETRSIKKRRETA